jgi:hypothetical protein
LVSLEQQYRHQNLFFLSAALAELRFVFCIVVLGSISSF